MDTHTNSSTLQDHSTLATSGSDIKLPILNKFPSTIGDHESMANHTLTGAETTVFTGDFGNNSNSINNNNNLNTSIPSEVNPTGNTETNTTSNDPNDAENSNTPTLYFFNYHEYTETYYAEVDTPTQFKGHTEEESLVITHFPNIHAPINSVHFNETRIVRIPRRFETSVDYPCFSNVLPGYEPAAITDTIDGLNFVPRGVLRDGQVYGLSSVSPLSQYLTNEEFQLVVDHINDILKTMYTVSNNWANYRDIILGFITLGLWYFVITSSKLGLSWLSCDRTRLSLLESYIESVNRSEKFEKNGVRIVSPRRSGFLSLDFEIPRPSL